jgi:hypothetical protein
MASSVVPATMISLPGVKNVSSPAHPSLNSGVPHAAASKSRPDGQYPIVAMARRVTFKVRRLELKNAGCSDGGRCWTKKTLCVQGNSGGYCAPPIRNFLSGSRRAGSMNNRSSVAWRSSA